MKKLIPITLAVILCFASCSKEPVKEFATETETETYLAEPETASEALTTKATTETRVPVSSAASTTAFTTTTTTTTQPITTTTAPATTTTTTTTTTTIPQFPHPKYDFNAAAELLLLVNAEREKHFLPPLALLDDLNDAADIRAKEISIKFSHTRPDGSNCDTVYHKDIGENVAFGQMAYEDVFDAWMSSSGHRANILDSRYTGMGASCYITSDGVKYWAQLFVI